LVFDMTPAVCRAARALTGITQRELAKAANMSAQTVADFERGARQPHANNLKALREFFEGKGLRLIEQEGVITAIDFADMEG
jgi:transcriptional regulator with XRE-family HTH domain